MDAIIAIYLLICIGLFAGCASIYGIEYDYNPKTAYNGSTRRWKTKR